MSSRGPIHLTSRQQANPQHIFRKLYTLEMQKRISQRERSNTLQRIEKIEGKLKKIDNAITELLASLDLCLSAEDKLAAKIPPSAAKSHDSVAKPNAAGNRQFVLRY